MTLLLSSGSLWAQSRAPRIEDLPKRPLDTIATEDPETRIILYANNTWSYYRPSLNTLDSLPIFATHWDTIRLFAYREIERKDIPSSVELHLVDDLSEFHAPIQGKVFSRYGRRYYRNHNGVDISLKIGEPIYATFEGKVRYARYQSGGYGNLVIVRHTNGLESWCGHLSKINVKQNDYVKAGQVIGYGGNTGRSTGPHLHFELRYQDQAFDPEFLIDFPSGGLKYQTFVLEKSFMNIYSRASEELKEEPLYDLATLKEDTTLTSEEILEIIAHAQTNTTGTKQSASTATAASGDAVYHTIVSGDILGRIAIRYGVTISDICRLNNINRNTTLRLGRKLRVK